MLLFVILPLELSPLPHVRVRHGGCLPLVGVPQCPGQAVEVFLVPSLLVLLIPVVLHLLGVRLFLGLLGVMCPVSLLGLLPGGVYVRVYPVFLFNCLVFYVACPMLMMVVLFLCC